MIRARTSYYQSEQQITVARALLKYLQIEGVNRLFGIPGAACMHVLNELKEQREEFTYYVCKQETGAAYIADGYARATGKLGVVLTTSGPGGTNALTGAMNANASHSPNLTITGEVPEKYFGRGYLQEGADAELDMRNVYGNSLKYSALVSSPTNFATLFTQALRTALSIPRRGAHISLPDDVAATPIDSIQFPARPENYRAVPQGASAPQVQRAFEMLMQAKRPLIFVGNGCRRVLSGVRLEMFQSFVTKFAIPVMTTPNGKGIFPEKHPMSLRSYGMAGCEWPFYYMQTAEAPAYDALLVLGSTLGELATNVWNPILIPDGPIMQVDLDQSIIARDFPVELGIVAELGAVCDVLFGLSEIATPVQDVVEGRRAFIAGIKKQHSPYFDPKQRESDSTPIHPARLIKAINDAAPPGSHLFVDAGNCVGWCMNYFEINPPTQLHSALAMGPMGFAVGATLGARIGAPDRTCLGVVGDGAFLMHGAEVSTAAQYGVGAIWVVLNDNDLAMVSQGMNHFFPDPPVWRDYYQLGKPDLAKMAEALGADAYNVRSPDDAQRALAEAIYRANTLNKPQVIVAHIDSKDVPPFYQPIPPEPSESAK